MVYTDNPKENYYKIFSKFREILDNIEEEIMVEAEKAGLEPNETAFMIFNSESYPS